MTDRVVVPFDPYVAHRRSLRDVYGETALRAFLRKLHRLAALKPETCRATLRMLDQTLDETLAPKKASASADTTRLLDKVKWLEVEDPGRCHVIESLIDRWIDQAEDGEPAS
jgi:hypothetical protein